MTENAESMTLDGWKEIVAYLATLDHVVSVRNAREYLFRPDPLPVYRRLGRVVAHKQALAEWVKRQTVHASAKPHRRRTA